MYQYIWDVETNGLLLTTEQSKFSKEPRPVYYKELDILGFDQYWTYPKDDSAPLMWAEANNYIYKGRNVARTKGGSLYTKPEIILLEDPEPDGAPLQFVDVEAMCWKNQELMETLVQETIQKIYNTFVHYSSKIDMFHVSFSGGKDSVVTLDLVQRALPHNSFVVLFGDTGMEFPDTYNVVEQVEQECASNNISFYRAKAPVKAIENWKVFGPPSSSIRWCCSVHKTTPQLLTLREILGKNDLIEMAFVGVRGDESVRRSTYDYVSVGTKQKGQYSCNPILAWSSSEVYLYIYQNNLHLNEAYKKGSSRAGCLYCPMATEKSDFINRSMYPNEVQPFIDVIKSQYIHGSQDEKLLESYLENKGWNARKNGRDLIIGTDCYTENVEGKYRVISAKVNGDSWKQWMKTVGIVDEVDGDCNLQVSGVDTIHFSVTENQNGYTEFRFKEELSKQHPTLFKYIKNNIKKSTSCVGCQHCAANCPHGNITFTNGMVVVNDACVKCSLCNRSDNGCLVFNSLILPKGTGKMKNGSVDEYGTHPVQMSWIEEFVEYKERFDEENTLGSAMLPMFKKFLRNAGIIEKNNSWNKLTQVLLNYGLSSEKVWALMLANLANSSQVGWLINNLKFNEYYTQAEIKNMLLETVTTKTGPGNVANSYRRMADLPFSKIGFGNVIGTGKDGFIFNRTAWDNPVPEVILYSLYKFAEACGDYYQFSLETLMDDSIERNGVSPTRIFGIDREEMVRILNGLSINYPEFISVSFTLDLDNITLRDNKTSDDVLGLF